MARRDSPSAEGAGASQGRRPHGGEGRGHHGRQAHLRPDPPLSPDRADPGRSDLHHRRRAGADRHRVRHPHRRPHRGGDGSPRRGRGGRHHHLRHVQGGGPGHGHRRYPLVGEDRRQGGLRPAGRRGEPAHAGRVPRAAPGSARRDRRRRQRQRVQGRAQEGGSPRSSCAPSTASRATPTRVPGTVR